MDRNLYRGIRIAIFCVCAALATGGICGAQTAKKADAGTDSTAAPVDSLQYSRTIDEYTSMGKRDPFDTLVPPIPTAGRKPLKKLFDYEDSSIRGIVITSGDTYALVVDQDEYAHVLREGYAVLGGHVTSITEEGIRFYIVKYGRAMTIIMRLESAKTTITAVAGDDRSIRRPGIELSYTPGPPAAEGLTIEDVILPPGGVLTVDRQWFAPDAPLETTAETAPEAGRTRYLSLIDPPDGMTIVLPHVLNWSTVQSEGIQYSVIIDDSGDFSTPLLLRGAIRSSSLLIDVDAGLPEGTVLYWKATGRDAAGNDYAPRQMYGRFTIGR